MLFTAKIKDFLSEKMGEILEKGICRNSRKCDSKNEAMGFDRKRKRRGSVFDNTALNRMRNTVETAKVAC